MSISYGTCNRNVSLVIWRVMAFTTTNYSTPIFNVLMRLCCYTRLVAMWAPVWPSESGRATCPVIVTFIREWTCLTRETVIVSPEFDNTERRGDTAVRRICEFLFFHVENLSLKIKEAYTHITIDGLRKRIRIIIIFFSFNQLELFEKKLTRNIRTAFLFNEDLINNKPYHCELLFIVESKDIHSSWNILIIIFEKKKKKNCHKGISMQIL